MLCFVKEFFSLSGQHISGIDISSDNCLLNRPEYDKNSICSNVNAVNDKSIEKIVKLDIFSNFADYICLKINVITL